MIWPFKQTSPSALELALAGINTQLAQLLKGQQMTQDDLTRILNEVTKEKTVEAALITLLTSVSAELKTAQQATDPAGAVDSIIAALDANITTATAAVTANTPASNTGTTQPPAAPAGAPAA